MTKSEMLAKFATVTATGIDAQCGYFLTEFVTEFAGCFEEVLELAQEFKQYTAPTPAAAAAATTTATPTPTAVRELEEGQMHLFLERRGETMTVKHLRDRLRTIDLDANGKTCFIEYCMFKYEKTLGMLFAEKPFSNQALLQTLEDAIAEFQAVLAARKEAEDTMAALQTLAESSAGGGVVKAMRARAELSQMRARSNTGQNVAEVRASFRKKRAKKALEAADPVAEELERVAAAKRAAEGAAAAAKAAGRRRLQERAAVFLVAA